MKLLTTEDKKYLLWVDEARYTTTDVWCYTNTNKLFPPGTGMFKTGIRADPVVAYLPLTTDAAPLEGVDLLPPLQTETGPLTVESVLNILVRYIHAQEDTHATARMSNQHGVQFRLLGLEDAAEIIAASGERKYSEEDMVNLLKWVILDYDTSAFPMGHPKRIPDDDLAWKFGGTEQYYTSEEMVQEYLQSLSPATPLPVAFEPQMKCIYATCGRTECDCGAGTIKTITLPDGRKQLVGQYKYKEEI